MKRVRRISRYGSSYRRIRDREALESEATIQADFYKPEIDEIENTYDTEPDYGGASDGNHVTSDADPGL